MSYSLLTEKPVMRHDDLVLPRSRADRISQHLKLALIFYTAIAVTAVGVLLLRAPRQKPHQPCSRHTIGSKYERDRRYMSLDHQYDGLWDTWGPYSQIMVPDDETGLGEVPAAISMIHQLHCLSGLRTALQESQEGKDVGLDWRDHKHWPHCFDYLRSTLLCFADATIETPAVVNGTRSGFIDGPRDMRQCKSQEPVYKLLELHAA